ncbi:MAG: glycosyltransferase [Alphaproteobacteria bacterium]|nr:glycosyltransferase [Alphaproteobacteria bacterium]
MKKFLICLSLVIVAVGIILLLFSLKPFPTKQTEDIVFKQINIISPTLNPTQGETFIAQDLASYFKSRGKQVRLFDPRSYITSPDFDPYAHAVNLFIYAWQDFVPSSHGINILYLLLPDEGRVNYKNFDLIATTSKKQARYLQKKGLPAVYIPQFSNTARFTHDYHKNLDVPLLFVGNLYDHDKLRPSVKYALENNFDIHVYGHSWERYIPAKYVKGIFIPNDELHKYYASAQIVLNDHQPKMIANGVISNRVFDVTASEGFLISDYMPEIEAVYHDSIPMYHSSKDFEKLISYYAAHPLERAQKAKKAHDITMRYFTLEKIGNQFMEEITKIVHKRLKEKTISFDSPM